MSDPTTAEQQLARKALDRLTDFMVDDILEMSDEELRAEIIEDGRDPDKIAEDMRQLFERCLHKAFPNRSQLNETKD